MTALREITIGDKAPFNSIHAKCVELDIDTDWCLRFKQKGREIASVTVGLVDDEKMRTIDYRDELIWRSLHVHLDEYRIVQFSPIEMRREKGPRISLLGSKFRSSDTPSLVAAEVVDGAQSGLFRQSQLPKIRIYDESVTGVECFIMYTSSRFHQQKVWDKVIDPIAKEHKLSHINRKAVNDFVPAIGC
ncbi:hypothetical protein E3P86_02399 [Wallemia ichthyophaga]|uniref:Uncharacterized protein n=1 Tax=Wallemia ichthyophaga TaxID=245174 RepID=A0A4T0J315_WALIC|nr:hypothetical protein E3P86_02399 [Wallemia ichthyophaga]